MTREEIAKGFEDNGFVIVRGAFTEEEIAPVRDLTQRIIEYAEKGLEDPFEEYYMRHRPDNGVLYDVYQRHAEFRPLTQNKRVLEAQEIALGPDIFLFTNSLVYKPKGKNNEVPWHQDFMTLKDKSVKYITWMALDNVTPENGCLKVIPGSHKQGFLPSIRVKGETHHTRLDPSMIDETNAIQVPMNAGDVLIFNQLVLHSSELANSDKPRRAFRLAVADFDSVETTRATPIVLKGGSPEALAKLYSKKYVPKNEPFFKKAMHAVGDKLSKA